MFWRAMGSTIRLSVPGELRYRDIAVRVVAETARLVSGSERRDPNDLLDRDVRVAFDTAVVSAFMEIFNNVVVHAYRRATGGAIEIALTPAGRALEIEIEDHGSPFDIEGVAPLPTARDVASLPEGGMGIHIATTMLDGITYHPGPPNRWRLWKRLPDPPGAGDARRT